MKKLIYLIFLLPILTFAQSDSDNQTAIDSLKTNTARNNNAKFLWRLYTGLNTSKLNESNPAFILTTSGTTGAATYDSGILNIPIYIGGITPIAQGGTGQTTAAAAFDALAPSQGSNSGKFLSTNGSTTSWASPFSNLTNTRLLFAGSTAPNSASDDTDLTWSTSTNTLSTSSIIINSNTTLLPISLFSLSGNTDDYNILDGTFFRISAGGAYNLTGIANGTGGRMIILRNTGSNNISLLHNNSGSATGNRFFFSTGTTIVLGADHQITLIYDGVDQRWVDQSMR